MTNTGTLYDIVASLFLFLGKWAEVFWRLILIIALLGDLYFLQQARKEKRISGWLFLSFNLLCFILLRLPSFAANELNADEGEWIAGASTLSFDPRFWLSVDGTTSGPLNIFPLTIISKLGIPIGFASARFFKMLVFDFPMILCVYHCIKGIADKLSAMLSVFLLTIFLGALVQKDIYAYGSENVPMFLIAVELLLLSVSLSKPFFAINIFSGLIVGMLPFSKLQSAYIAVLLGITHFSVIIFWHSNDLKKKLLQGSTFVISAITPLIVLLVYLKANHLTDDFLQSYVFNNISYTAKISMLQTWMMPILLCKKVKGLALLFAITLAFFLFALINLSKELHSIAKKEKAISIFILLFLLISWYSIGKPGRGFEHYLNFIYLPFVVSCGYSYFLIRQYTPASVFTKRYIPSIICFLIVFQFCVVFYNGNYLIQRLVLHGKVRTNPICNEIKKLRKNSEDRLVVWGWQITDTGWGSHNKYYLESDLIQGTRESHSERQQSTFEQNNSKTLAQFEYYRNRYMGDIRKNRPIFFIDLNSSVAGLFPELSHYIDSNYVKMNQWQQFHHDTIPITSVLYVRNERYNAMIKHNM